MAKSKNKFDPLTSDEEEQLQMLISFKKIQPQFLNYITFYLISQQFGIRGCQEHHRLQVEELKFVYGPSGMTLYVE